MAKGSVSSQSQLGTFRVVGGDVGSIPTGGALKVWSWTLRYRIALQPFFDFINAELEKKDTDIKLTQNSVK